MGSTASTGLSATEDIKSRLPLSDLVGNFVRLESKGSEKTGCCPFHKEKTPSFFVNDLKGVFHCYGCNKGGDHFTFIMDLKGLDFPGALQELASMSGVDLSKYKSTRNVATRNPKETEKSEKLIRVNKIAGLYFQKMLFSDEGKAALDYMKNRGITEETLKKFKVGYAPDEFEALTQELKRAGVPDDLALELGLVRTRKSAKGHYDTFRNRVIFPIWDSRARPIAFGGRLLPSEKNPENSPKYLNSPESELFKKSETLYGIHLARKSIKDLGEVILTEGYMDVISLNQAGFENTVAALGTALSENHLLSLKQVLGGNDTQGSVLLMLDGDAAGIKAAKRAFPISQKTAVHTKISILPEGKDAADVLTDPSGDGSEKLKHHITNSVDLIEVMIDDLIKEKGKSLDDRTKVAEEAISWIANATGSALSKTVRINELSDRLNLPADGLKRIYLSKLSGIKRSAPQRPGFNQPHEPQGDPRFQNRNPNYHQRNQDNHPYAPRWSENRAKSPIRAETLQANLPKAELEMLRLLAKYPEYLEALRVNDRKDEILNWFSDLECKTLLQTALDCGVFKDLSFQSIKRAVLRSALTSALIQGKGAKEEEPETVLEDALIKLEIGHLKSVRLDLMAEIRINPDKTEELAKQEFEIISRIHALKESRQNFNNESFSEDENSPLENEETR